VRATLAIVGLLAMPVFGVVGAQRLTEPLVFASDRHGNIDLYLLDPSANEPRRLTHDPAAELTARTLPS
jgi:hypothetical protein